jgi:hypothetical protein
MTRPQPHLRRREVTPFLTELETVRRALSRTSSQKKLILPMTNRPRHLLHCFLRLDPQPAVPYFHIKIPYKSNRTLIPPLPSSAVVLPSELTCPAHLILRMIHKVMFLFTPGSLDVGLIDLAVLFPSTNPRSGKLAVFKVPPAPTVSGNLPSGQSSALYNV